MAVADYYNIAQKFYVAYFGRPADPSGLANIAASLAAANAPTTTQAFVDAYHTNATVRSIIDSFGDSSESHELYAGDTRAFVTAIFQNVLGRAPGAEGLNYWAQSIDQGALGRGSAALTIMAGAESNTSSQGKVDAATVAAKIVLASQFTSALGTPVALASYSGKAAASAARAMLGELSSVTATLERLIDPVPGALDLLAADDSGSSSTDNITRATSGLTITGLAPGAARVELFDGAAKVGSGTVTNGSFSVDIALSAAVHAITAVGYTTAGVKSRSSAALSVTVDTGAPGGEVLASLVEDSGASGDAITNNASLSLAGIDAGNYTQYSKDGASWTSTYTPAVGANIVMVRQTDTAGNGGPVSVFKFTYDKTAPQLSTSVPSNNVKEVGHSSDIVLTMSETVLAGNGDIIVSDGLQDRRVISMSDTSQVQVIGKTVTINPAQALNPETRYFVTLPTAAVTDAAGNAVAAVNLSFTTVDATIPVLESSMPAASRANVSPLSNLYLDFSESVKAGAGSVTISDGASDRRVISINDKTQVSINGSTVTVNPILPLKNGATYSVQVDAGALKDLSGNAYGGMAVGSLAFNTASASLDLATLAPRDGYKMLAPARLYSSQAGFYYQGSELGASVAGVGDVNGDGMADFIVAPGSGMSTNREQQFSSTYTYISFLVYGSGDATPATLDLTTLDSSAALRLSTPTFDGTGYMLRALSAGDVNGDNLPDLLLGNHYANDSTDLMLSGKAWMVYGAPSASRSTVNLNALNGADGYRMNGTAQSVYLGESIGAGDVNGDGLMDVLIGMPGPGDPQTRPGSSYLLFGSTASASAVIDPASLNGSNGVRIDGVRAADGAGGSVAGDFNGDGYADIAIGANWSHSGSGGTYLVFGKTGQWNASLNMASISASTGVRITHSASSLFNGFGRDVAAAGDLNGDGFADLLIQAPATYDKARGDAYIVFGHANDSSGTLDAAQLDGKNGFRVSGLHVDNGEGFSLIKAGGDINGDGYDDLLIGMPTGTVDGKDMSAVYVVFGKANGFAATIDPTTLGAASGWRITGTSSFDWAGASVSVAGDVNGDGFDDIIIGAPHSHDDLAGGSAYIVYGRDVTGSVRFLGDSGNDSLTGSAAAENFVSGNGNDLMVGGGGADAFHGGAGDDIIVLADMTARRIDGGSGSDTLRLSGAGQTLDMALFRNRIDSIETIDLTGSGNNTLKVLARDLLNLNEQSNTLTVDGNAGDKVVLGTGWTDGGVAGGYHQYVQGQAVILVGVDLTVTL